MKTISLLFAMLLWAGNPHLSASARRDIRPLSSDEMRQFVRCMLKTEVDRKKYGPVARFRYRLSRTSDPDSDADISAIVYRTGSEKEGIFVVYSFLHRRCIAFELGNFAPLVLRHGKPDLDEEHMGNGGIGTYNGFMQDLRKLQKEPLVEMDFRELPRTGCEKCIGWDDQLRGVHLKRST